MREHYLSWCEQALRGLEEGAAARPLEPGRGPLLVCGMGGSGIVGDYLASLLYDRSRNPVIVVKDRRPPSWIDGETTVLGISYSGNTAETLECVEEASASTDKIALFSSGGRMRVLAETRGYPFIGLTSGLEPRAALAEMMYAVLGYLETLGLSPLSRGEIEASLDVLGREELYTAAPEVARLLHGRIPVVLAPGLLAPLATRWKNELNENAKVQAKAEWLPEWGHNDVVGWEIPVEAPHAFVLLDDPGDEHSRRLLDFASEWYGRIGPVARIELRGGSRLSMLMHGSLLAGLVSLELASLRGVDPRETRGISLYKEAYRGG